MSPSKNNVVPVSKAYALKRSSEEANKTYDTEVLASV